MFKVFTCAFGEEGFGKPFDSPLAAVPERLLGVDIVVENPAGLRGLEAEHLEDERVGPACVCR